MIETTIARAGQFEGEDVTIKGWLYNKRSSGKINFLIIRDGTGLMQAVMLKQELPEEQFNMFDELTRDCLLYTSPSPRDRTRSRMPSSA